MNFLLAFASDADVDSIDAVLGPLIMLGILVAVTYFGYRRWRLSAGARNWTLTEAKIQSGYGANMVNATAARAVGGVMGSVIRDSTWRAALQYSYEVAGESWSGYFLLGPTYSTSQDADAATREWIDKKISIRYNPAKPHESSFLSADGAPLGSRSLGDQAPPGSDVITLSLR